MLRPTFLSFETAKRSITAAQYALDTVGHNLANIDTPGYTRQRVDLASFRYGTHSRYRIYGQQLPGQGVNITGISQIRDPSLDVRYRAESANWGELAVTSSALADLNKIFDEISTDGLGVQFQKFSDAIAKMESGATDQDYAMVVRTTAEQISSLFNIYAKDVDRVESEQLSDLDVVIKQDVNLVLQQIADLSEKIEQQHIYGAQPNEMLDDRNMLIDTLSELMDIQVSYTKVTISEDRHIERINIKLKETGDLLVKGREYNQFELETADTDGDGTGDGLPPVTIKMIDNITDPNNPTSKVMNEHLNKGALAGYLDILNGEGSYYDSAADTDKISSDYRGIPYYRESLDELARAFASVLNGINAKDYDSVTNGTKKDLFVTMDGTTGITAKNITISQAWRDDTSYLSVSSHENPASAENDLLLLFKEAMTTKTHTFNKGPNTSPLNSTFGNYLTTYQAELGLDQNLADTLYATSNRVMSGLMDSRDQISAVSLNEEANDMMKFQNYYNASVRYLTVLDEAVDKIINGMGLVGR